MNRYTLYKAGINISEGMERLKLDKATYESLLITFLNDNSFDLLCQSINEKDVSSSFLYAHSLKGLSSNLSLIKLTLLLSPIVETLKKGSFENVEESMPEVKEAYQLIREIIQKESYKE